MQQLKASVLSKRRPPGHFEIMDSTLDQPLLDARNSANSDDAGTPVRSVRIGGGGDDAFCSNHVSTTKYTMLSLVPVATFEQFRRLANIYFLVVSMLMLCAKLQLGIFESSLNPYTTLGPLVIIVLMTDFKQGVEDWKRHKSDELVNNRKAVVMGAGDGAQAGAFQTVEKLWKDVRVGEIVRIEDKRPFPADVILLASSTDNGMGECSCFVETASIDGETNLKLREAINHQFVPSDETLMPEGGSFSSQKEQAAKAALATRFRGTMEFEAPNPSLETFTGAIRLDGGAAGPGNAAIPLGPENVLLRGSTLQNTGWAWVLVVYTGTDSKLMQNAQPVKSKQSKMDLLVNRCIVLIMLCQIALSVVITVSGIVFDRTAPFVNVTRDCVDNECDLPGYLGGSSKVELVFGDEVGLFLTYFVLFSNVVPISLYVTIEMVGLAQGYLIENDKEMYHEDTDTAARAQTANLIGDLGQVQWIFSDKTGTLTCNEMHLRQCFVAGRTYGDRGAKGTFRDGPLKQRLRSGSEQAGGLSAFFRALAVCHTVVVEHDEEGRATFRSESPDEAALVEAARAMGVLFTGRTSTELFIELGGNSETYELLGVNEFNSTRKRMSLVVREKRTNKIKIICKGADNIMFQRCHSSVDVTPNGPFAGALMDFAKLGLRTLVVAERELSVAEFEAWQTEYLEARSAMVDRAEKLAGVAEKVERGLRVLGITAIEDRLQDGVPSTIRDLADAGIKLWVLTGDKQETAVNIGYSCSLLDDTTNVIIIDGKDRATVDRQLEKFCEAFGAIAKKRNILQKAWNEVKGAAHMFATTLLTVGTIAVRGATPHGLEDRRGEKRASASGRLALVIPGCSLEHILDFPKKAKKFVGLGKLCDVLIACRVSPSQKAKLVRVVRKYANVDEEKIGGDTQEEPMTLAIGDGANDVGMILEAHLGVGISGKEGMQAVNNSDFAIAQFRFLRRLLLIHGRWSYLRTAKVFLYSFSKNVALVFTLFFFATDSAFSGQSLYTSWLYAGYNFYLGMPIIAVGFLTKDISSESVLKVPQLYATGRLNMLLSLESMVEWVVMGFLYAFVVYFVGRRTGQEVEGFESFGTRVLFCLIVMMQVKVVRITDTFTVVSGYFQAFSWLLFFSSVAILDYIPWFLNTDNMRGVFVDVFLSWDTYMYIIIVAGIMEIVELVKEHLRLQYRPNAIDIIKEIDSGVLATESGRERVARRSSIVLEQRANRGGATGPVAEAVEETVDSVAKLLSSQHILQPRSSYAYDHPSMFSHSKKKSIVNRRRSFGRGKNSWG
jgi:phospholipid-transporting ATPase